MIEKYKPLRQSILDYHTSKDYEGSIKQCYLLLEQILSKENKQDDEWYCYHMLSFNYYVLKNFDIAIENGKYAALLIKNYNTGNYTRTIWHLGNCHKELGNIKEAIRMFKICIRYYKSINSNKLRLTCIFNVSKLLKMPNIMEKALNLYAKENNKADVTVYNQNEYEQSVINQMYIDTFEMYINLNKSQEAVRLLATITNRDVKKSLCKKLLIA